MPIENIEYWSNWKAAHSEAAAEREQCDTWWREHSLQMDPSPAERAEQATIQKRWHHAHATCCRILGVHQHRFLEDCQDWLNQTRTRSAKIILDLSMFDGKASELVAAWNSECAEKRRRIDVERHLLPLATPDSDPFGDPESVLTVERMWSADYQPTTAAIHEVAGLINHDVADTARMMTAGTTIQVLYSIARHGHNLHVCMQNLVDTDCSVINGAEQLVQHFYDTVLPDLKAPLLGWRNVTFYTYMRPSEHGREDFGQIMLTRSRSQPYGWQITGWEYADSVPPAVRPNDLPGGRMRLPSPVLFD